jgi:hypothetical protein
MPATAGLLVQYRPAPPTAEKPPVEEVLTTCPSSPCASMRGSSVTRPLMTPPTLTPMQKSQSLNVAVCIGPRTPTPALFTRT